jgi:hypothetical protein
MKYELLLRKAFGFAANGKTGDRSCDPGDLAEAGLFTDRNLAKVRTGAAYAFTIFSTAVINHVQDTLPNGEYDRLEKFTARALGVSNVAELAKLIQEFETSVVEKYFNIRDGNITTK